MCWIKLSLFLNGYSLSSLRGAQVLAKPTCCKLSYKISNKSLIRRWPHHRGSLLGQIPGRLQPGQRLFESLLVNKLMQFNPSLPVFIESESSRIGNLQIPAPLWRVMTNAPLVTLDVPVSARAAYLVSVYERLTLDPSDLLVLIDGMVRRHGYDITSEWKSLLKQKDWQNLAESLLTAHYDPAYDQSVSKHNREQWLYLLQENCSEEQREKSVHKIISKLGEIAAARLVKPR